MAGRVQVFDRERREVGHRTEVLPRTVGGHALEPRALCCAGSTQPACRFASTDGRWPLCAVSHGPSHETRTQARSRPTPLTLSFHWRVAVSCHPGPQLEDVLQARDRSRCQVRFNSHGANASEAGVDFRLDPPGCPGVSACHARRWRWEQRERAVPDCPIQCRQAHAPGSNQRLGG